MERILSVAEMRAADKFTVETLGIDEEELISRAGEAVAKVINKKFKGGRVLIVCGKGNNGKDGREIAKNLIANHGFSVTVFDVWLDDLRLIDHDYDVIIDCIFGTGLNKKVEGIYKDVIEAINGKNAFVISVDIPSGLNGDTGLPMGVSVKADMTVAIQEYKLGHFLGEGKDYSGKVVAKDIGISIFGEGYAYKLTDEDVSPFFPERNSLSNKGDYGKACIIGGSVEYTGAPLLSLNSLNALRTGAGYSYLVVPEEVKNAYIGLNPECILSGDGDLNTVLDMDAIAFGMGSGVSEKTYSKLKFLLFNYKGNLIIDADGLNSLSAYGVDILKTAKCKVLITPHVGEFARLTGKTKEEVLADPILNAKEFSKTYGVTVLLKNNVSVIADGDDVCVNVTGSPALAKCGSGDTLSGLICGMATRCDLPDSARVSAYIFGKAGELASKELSDYSVTASDVSLSIGKVIKELQ